MKKFLPRLLITFGVFLFCMRGRSAVNTPHRLKDSLKSEQLVIVVSDNWTSIRSMVYCFEKRKGKWLLRFSFPAVVGKSGMALGEGMSHIKISGAPEKTEGDMKSPAGIFPLGPAFGYADKKQAGWISFPYVRVTDTLICVDDGTSRYYNELIHTDSVTNDWHSYENMYRPDEDYKWGIFVQHNFHPVKKGKGSCIFLHIWESPGEGTAGCTAMEEKNILKLLHWIRTKKNPLLVQCPIRIYKKLTADYNLPVL